MRPAIVTTILVATGLLTAAATPARCQDATPVYTPAGEMVLPKGYEAWGFIGSNLGLAYNDEVLAMTARERARADAKLFHNIYLNPKAYQSFLETGEFPDPMVLVMELYTAEDKDPGGVLKGGLFNGSRTVVETAVKDSKRPTRPGSEGIWAYYLYPLEESGAPAETAESFPDAACSACHERHARYDNVWVQFYPRLAARVPK